MVIDDQLAEAHVSMGYVMFYDWNWSGAERAFRRAVAAGPGYATGHQWFSEYLITHGRFDEAEHEARRALALDPMSPLMENSLSDVLFFSRRYEEALAVVRRMLELNPHYIPGLTDLGRTLTELGVHDEAIAMFEQARAITKGLGKAPAGLAYALARAGRTEEARRMLAEIEARMSETGAIGSRHAIAVIHLALGDAAAALEWLERAHAARDQALVWLKVHPRLDPLRGEPRFERIRVAMGLGE